MKTTYCIIETPNYSGKKCAPAQTKMKTKKINATLIILSVLFFGQLIIRLIFF